MSVTGGRLLIVNADDFGQSDGVNRGVIQAHQQGIVTSASLMVRWPAAAQAAAYAVDHPELGLGLHLDLGEWAFRNGEWRALYVIVDTDDAAAVGREVESQLAEFRRLTGRDPDHLDSHQHVHRERPTADIVATVAESLGVPVRDNDPGITYCGSFYGQTSDGRPYPEAITVDALVSVVRGLPDGTTELGCHPGFAGGLESMYVAEREIEVDVLTDPRVRRAVHEEGVRLVTFPVRAAGRPAPPPRSATRR